MAHHSTVPNDLLSKALGLGPTGQYPNGKADETDEGEIVFAVAADKDAGIVRISFGKPIASLGMTGEQASDLADLLTKKAWELRGIA